MTARKRVEALEALLGSKESEETEQISDDDLLRLIFNTKETNGPYLELLDLCYKYDYAHQEEIGRDPEIISKWEEILRIVEKVHPEVKFRWSNQTD
jgi:hypothetical protein